MREPKGLVIGMLILVGVAALVAAPALAADESNMEEKAKAWEAASNAGDLAAVAAMYAEDGCRMPPHMATVHGREAILASLQEGLEAGLAQVQIAVTESMSGGDLAYAIGTFMIIGPDGEHTDHGKWMNTSRRSGEEWVIYCDIWNSDMPMDTGGE